MASYELARMLQGLSKEALAKLLVREGKPAYGNETKESLAERLAQPLAASPQRLLEGLTLDQLQRLAGPLNLRKRRLPKSELVQLISAGVERGGTPGTAAATPIRYKLPIVDVVENVERARAIASEFTRAKGLAEWVAFGLPEFDDRRGVWRVPLLATSSPDDAPALGEVLIDARSGKITRATDENTVRRRCQRALVRDQRAPDRKRGQRGNGRQAPPPFVHNKVVWGDAADVVAELPPNSIQLVFTSPPYYNAKPEYAEYFDYQEYLDLLRRVFLRCHEVLSEGRFLIVNASPVLVARKTRQSASRRIPVPFDIHHLLDGLGFDFVDDIVWVKPEGAGWATGRGRRFSADRNPLQYKPVPVTEYLLVYRKHTSRLIDWSIRTHHDPEAVKSSKILGAYDVTNIWHIPPAHHKSHPAVFPDALVERVLRYYSFAGDCVLDPFAGTGTVGRAALRMGRRFFLVDNDWEYFQLMRDELIPIAARAGAEVLFEPETPEEAELLAQYRKQLTLPLDESEEA
jgi:DNA modification methylase